ncbi:MAG TPA: TonB-dependent receptor plug domain-containing protein, partial [Paludibacter sp.]|nr:TonB-dependent receptor plug domain-containing protein [Paludibacter sp.]
MNRSKNLFIKICALLVLIMFYPENNLKAQNKSVNPQNILKGVILDANTGKPIAAAQISVLYKNLSTVSDEKGVFRLLNTTATDVIQVNAFDYSVREYPVQGNDSLIIKLYPDVFSNYYKQIDGLNGSVNNSALTSSIKGINKIGFSEVVSPDDILLSELGGDVRNIKRSAVSGMGSSLFIRGLNSINANAQPLYIIDGVIWNNLYDVSSIHDGFFSNPLTNIDITDIESITVIKDGTSVYGSKASNGIVQIKTKRGSNMATKINLNIVTGITTSPQTMPVMNADQYRIYVSEILGSAGLTNNEIAQLPYLNDDPMRSTYKLYHNNTNWNDEIYQNGVSTNYSINVNGGDEKALYYFSLGYTGNDGVVKSTDFQRYNMRLNADVSMTKAITLGINIGIASINRRVIDDGVNAYTSPTWLSLIKSPFLSPTNYTSLGDKTSEYTFTDIFDVGNPGGVIKFANNTVKQYRFNVGIKPVIQITPNFTLTEQLDYNLNKTNEDYYRPYLYSTPVFIQRIGNSYNARMSQVMRNNSIFSDTRLNYQKKLDEFNRINAFIGTRYIYEYFESDYVEGHNSLNNSSNNLVGGFKNLLTDGVNNLRKSISHYANVDYSYDNRYFLNAVLSIDGSSRFGTETKSGFNLFGHSWGVFPSINGAWLISSEKFMSTLSGINLLKFRAGYGITGNDNIEDYKTMAY